MTSEKLVSKQKATAKDLEKALGINLPSSDRCRLIRPRLEHLNINYNYYNKIYGQSLKSSGFA